MRAFKALVTGIALAVISVAPQEVVVANDKPGTAKVTVIGVDGKPVQNPDVRTVDEPTDKVFKPDVKGRIVTVYVTGLEDNRGSMVVYLPDGKETPVTIQMKPRTDFQTGYKRALQGKGTGNAKFQQEGYDEAKQDLEYNEQYEEQIQKAIDDWARDNNIPIMTLSGIDKQIKRAEGLGANQDKTHVDNLKAYKAKLEALDRVRTINTFDRERLAEIAPSPKKVTMVPGACPEGQSGGLLAGFLNSVTGSNTFAGICDDEERQNDNKERKQRDPEKHDRD